VEDELVVVWLGRELWCTDFGRLTVNKLQEIVDASNECRVSDSSDEDGSIASMFSSLKLDLR
jgi:hypothetical protein